MELLNDLDSQIVFDHGGFRSENTVAIGNQFFVVDQADRSGRSHILCHTLRIQKLQARPQEFMLFQAKVSLTLRICQGVKQRLVHPFR